VVNSPQLLPEVVARGAEAGAGHGVAVRAMFDRISPTYDLLNRLLSWGIDRRWRREALDVLAERLPPDASLPLLDICAGTLDLTTAMQARFGERAVVALDFARDMLLSGRAKLARPAGLAVSDAMQLPLVSDAFAGAVCGFGMRNLTDPARGVREAARVLAPGGVLVVLEFFKPVRASTRLFHAVYGNLLLPLVGRLVSGDAEAYRYLSRSMQGFLTRQQFEASLREAGLRDVQGRDLFFGVASLVWGVKP
jgi:ubiquinone/menaquinone biosynthesis methyltransferase